MSLDITLSLHEVKGLEDRRTLERVLALYKTLGYELSKMKVGRSSQQAFIDHGTHLEGAVPHALALKRLWFVAKNSENGLDLSVAINWSRQENEKPYLWNMTDQIMLFTGSDYRPEIDRFVYQKALLALGKGLYEITAPTFGLIGGGEPGMGPSDTELESLRLPRLYWVNFFGPAYVAEVGREKLLNAPVGSTEVFADGGVLYCLDRDLIGPDNTNRNREQMLHYFGM